MARIRWGIYGPGHIARKFVDAFNAVIKAHITAVAGRTPERAAQFAAEFRIPHAVEDLEALANHSEVDAVYIANTHNAHFKAARACLEAGKAVLCEKPLAMNAAQVQALIDVAHKRSAFLMEALWTRFLPVFGRVRQLIEDDAIGPVRVITAEFGTCARPDPESRLMNKNKAGGAILDLGVYPIGMTQMVYGGEPETIEAQGILGPTGVDEITLLTLGFSNRRTALIGASIVARMENRMVIAGERGRIKIPEPFPPAQRLEWTPDGKETLREHYPHRHNGFEEQIEEVGRCLREGIIQSPRMPHHDSLAIARIMDEARRRIGLRYDADDDIEAGA
ncbi:MAG: Gfo/Idh/MocA family oxidoreductase [Phycisphaeraceae bacterium]|nr:Gfo/Idh/MocA family oxidoreductase [Phycisphaeraceae bacterium]